MNQIGIYNICNVISAHKLKLIKGWTTKYKYWHRFKVENDDWYTMFCSYDAIENIREKTVNEL